MGHNRGPTRKRQRASVLSKQSRSQRMHCAVEKMVLKRIAVRPESVTSRMKELAERNEMDAEESTNTVVEVPGSWQIVSGVSKDSNTDQNLFGDLQQLNIVPEMSSVTQGPSVDQNVPRFRQNPNVVIEVSSSVPYSKETTVKPKKPLKESVTIWGRRIVDVAFFLETLKELNKHSKSKCDLNDMLIMREERKGLVTCFHMKCTKCNFQSLVWSEDPENESQDINADAVVGMVSISGDYRDLDKLLTKMRIPMMTKYMFDKEYQKIFQEFENNLEKESEMEDKEITIQPMEIDEFLIKDPDEIDRRCNVEEYDEPVETPLPPREIEIVVNEDKPVESDITQLNGITIKQEIVIDTDEEKLTHESGAEPSGVTEHEIEKALEKEIGVFQCKVKPEKVEDVQALDAESDGIAVVQELSTGGVTAIEESSTASQDAQHQFKLGETTTMQGPSTAVQADVQCQFNLAEISAVQVPSKTINEVRLQHNITPAQKLPTTTYVKNFQSGFCVLSSDIAVVQKLLTTTSVKGLQCSLKPPSPSPSPPLKPGVPASVSQQQGESHCPRVSSSETDSSNTSVVQALKASGFRSNNTRSYDSSLFTRSEVKKKIIELVKRYGPDNWPLISDVLGNRIALQCHESSNSTRSYDLSLSIGPEIKKKIAELVKKYGSDNWPLIADALGSTLAMQCHESLNNIRSDDSSLSIRPEMNKCPQPISANGTSWTKEEDESLKKYAQCYQHLSDGWRKIASFLPNHTEFQCRQRWLEFLNLDPVKGRWTEEEDQKLVELVKKYGPCNWRLIADSLQGRIAIQCRNRWFNQLSPNIRKAWTPEEEKKIVEYHSKWGSQWSKIAECLPGRTANDIKNYFDSTHRKQMKWTKEEEQLVVEHVEKNGPKRWGLIALQLKSIRPPLWPERTASDIKNYFDCTLQKQIKWTKEEEQIVVEHVKRNGPKKWNLIAQQLNFRRLPLLPERTANSVKNHWNNILQYEQPIPTTLNIQVSDEIKAALGFPPSGSSTAIYHVESEDPPSSQASFQMQLSPGHCPVPSSTSLHSENEVTWCPTDDRHVVSQSNVDNNSLNISIQEVISLMDTKEEL